MEVPFLYLPLSAFICLYLPLSAFICLYLPLSAFICLYLPLSAFICRSLLMNVRAGVSAWGFSLADCNSAGVSKGLYIA
ncbi:hypothetical protein EN794_014535 [Mesorhizobium sp. M00.F.Ca.ET.151.01.1.1]|nr:hypothetical protein EN794_014535 [Mesorhizobium sp. M00.F.Ca.ET.151.01.1.1]